MGDCCSDSGRLLHAVTCVVLLQMVHAPHKGHVAEQLPTSLHRRCISVMTRQAVNLVWHDQDPSAKES